MIWIKYLHNKKNYQWFVNVDMLFKEIANTSFSEDLFARGFAIETRSASDPVKLRRVSKAKVSRSLFLIPDGFGSIWLRLIELGWKAAPIPSFNVFQQRILAPVDVPF